MVKIISLFMIDLKTLIRYKIELFSYLLMIFTVVMPIFPMIFGGTLNLEITNGVNYPLFLCISTTYWCYIEEFWSAIFSLRRQMQEGILEQMMLLPINSFQFLIGLALKGILATSIKIIPLLIVTISIISSSFNLINALMVITIFIISIIANYGLCLILIGLGMLFTEIDQIISLLGNIAPFICGLFLPISAIPILFSSIGLLFPFTWALDLIRNILLNTNLLISFETEMLIFIFMSLIYCVFGTKLYQIFLKKSKLNGLNKM